MIGHERGMPFRPRCEPVYASTRSFAFRPIRLSLLRRCANERPSPAVRASVSTRPAGSPPGAERACALAMRVRRRAQSPSYTVAVLYTRRCAASYDSGYEPTSRGRPTMKRMIVPPLLASAMLAGARCIRRSPPSAWTFASADTAIAIGTATATGSATNGSARMRRHTIGATIAAATATGAMAIAGETTDAATTIASTGYGPTVRPASARAGCALGAGGACFVHARRADIEPDARDCQRSFGAGERKGAQGAIALCSFASSDRSPFP